jgi:hypothetical protein
MIRGLCLHDNDGQWGIVDKNGNKKIVLSVSWR